MPAEHPKPVTLPETAITEIGPRVYGYFDLVRPDRVAGWAIDRASSAAAVDVEIHREGRLVATVRADRHRPDLEKGGVGSGDYGFVADIAPPLEPGFEFTLTAVARAADGTRGDLRRGGGKSGPVSPEQRVIERLFEEVLRIGQLQARAAKTPADGLDRLAEMVGRVELVQIRLEAALARVEPVGTKASHGGLRGILFTTLAIALGSLGVGLYSLLLA